MLASTVFVLAAAMAQSVIGAESSITGYGVDILEWDVEVAPGKTKVLNGTVEEVYSQVLKLNPDFKLAPVPETRAVRQYSQMQKRNVNCGTYQLAWKDKIQDGIYYLRTLGAAPRNGPGPGNCGRVSCSYGAAIWWCNDNTEAKTLDSWNWLANSAQHIVNTCAAGSDRVSGQNFEEGNWNTIVRGDNC